MAVDGLSDRRLGCLDERRRHRNVEIHRGERLVASLDSKRLLRSTLIPMVIRLEHKLQQ